MKKYCEDAKIVLSYYYDSILDIDELIEGKDFNITINRQEFEDLCKEDLNKCIPIVDNELKDANLTKDKIDDIIFVGGSTRIPKIQ